MRLRALAPAKVNLCLFLGPARGDGRHELVTVFQSLSLADTITLSTDVVEQDTVDCGAVSGVNLASTALADLRARGWDGPPLRIEIDKQVPIAAGMAGGSADAAATLRLAETLTPAGGGDLELIAAALGSDVPSQLIPGVAIGTGAGDIVERLPALAEHAYVVLPSPVQLSTADVYREADRMELARSAEDLAILQAELTESLKRGGRVPSRLIINDLQPAAVSLCPTIGLALGAALAAGADHAIVSGSGPTVVGIWWGKDAATRAASAVDVLSEHYPGAVAAVPVGPEFGVPEQV